MCIYPDICSRTLEGGASDASTSLSCSILVVFKLAGWEYVATLVPTNILFPQKSQIPSLLTLVDEMVGMPASRLNLNET